MLVIYNIQLSFHCFFSFFFFWKIRNKNLIKRDNHGFSPDVFTTGPLSWQSLPICQTLNFVYDRFCSDWILLFGRMLKAIKQKWLVIKIATVCYYRHVTHLYLIFNWIIGYYRHSLESNTAACDQIKMLLLSYDCNQIIKKNTHEDMQS